MGTAVVDQRFVYTFFNIEYGMCHSENGGEIIAQGLRYTDRGWYGAR